MDKSQQEQEKTPANKPVSERLESWKEIAVYLDRDVRTVIRWEKKEGLPVRRHLHDKQATVYAYRSEIEGWLAERKPLVSQEEKLRGWLSSLRERKLTVAGIAVGAVLVLVAGLVWSFRLHLFPPGIEALHFRERDFVLISHFENHTGESALDGVLEYALEREVVNSQFVNVVPGGRIQDTLRLMKKSPETLVDATVGREICLRDGGIRALLAGRAEKIGSVYVLSVEVVNPVQGVSVASASQEAASEEQIWAAVRELSSWVRQTLGEAVSEIHESAEKLEKVTTPSLPALKLYSQAMAISYQRIQRSRPAFLTKGKFLLPSPLVTIEPLLRQALAEDPEFASAHILLAWILEGRLADEHMAHAERALGLSEMTSERERYFILGSYHHMKGQNEQAITAYQALLRLYPDDYWATNNLALANRNLGRIPEALKYYARRADLRPQSLFDNTEAGHRLAISGGDLVAAAPYMERARQLIASEDLTGADDVVGYVSLFPAWKALIEGEPQEALQLADQAAQTIKRPNPRVAYFYFMLGKLRLARDWAGSDYAAKCKMAFCLGSEKVAKEQLINLIETPDEKKGSASFAVKGWKYHPGIAVLLTRFGLLSQDGVLERTDTSSEAVRGAIALEQGNLAAGTALLEKAVHRSQYDGWNLYFPVSDILADA